MTDKPAPKPLKSLSQIQSSYDIFFFDLWGVIHNGKQVFPEAIGTLQALKEIGKPVYFLSNAPRRVDAAMNQLIDRGVARTLYAGMFTSGEDTFEHLRDRADSFYLHLGSNLFHIGPEKDKNLFNELPFQEVPLKQADFILNTGTINFDDTINDYLEVLQAGVDLEIPMICANPDFIVIYGETDAICAGLLAKEYEKLGGNVRYHGKPCADIFEKLIQRTDSRDKSRILMIGDSLRTDIKGANAAGIDSIFITNGIHKLNSFEEADSLYAEFDATPNYIMERVQW